MKNYKLLKTYPGLPLDVIEGDIAKYEIFRNIARWTIKGRYLTFDEKYFEDSEFWEEVKEIFFITEDGVKITHGKFYYAVNEEYKIISYQFDENIEGKISSKCFSKERLAQEYLIFNKPCLSINDVAKVYRTANRTNDFAHKQSSQIQEMVKKILGIK